MREDEVIRGLDEWGRALSRVGLFGEAARMCWMDGTAGSGSSLSSEVVVTCLAVQFV